MSLVIFQRILSIKTPNLSRLLCRINKFSDSASTRDTDVSSRAEQSQDEARASDAEVNSDEGNDVSRLLKDAATYADAKDTSWATSPYPSDAPTSVEAEPAKPKIEPSEKCVVLFPGQGTLRVGSVRKYLRFPQAKELYELANEILDYDLLDLCLNGPQEKLDQTRYNQVATVVSSLAALEKLREERPRVFETCVATAGYSIGELTSLIFSGALTFEDGIRLVSVRGAAMQYAADKTPQGMLSVHCTPQAKIAEACKDAQKWAQDVGVADPVCGVAIYLYTQSKIIAGNVEALNYIEKNAKKYGLSKPARLPVSGAFHTKLMEPALKSFGKMLSTVQMDQFRCNVYSNYKGHVYGNTRLIKKYLLKQIVSPVKWEQTMQSIYNRPEGMTFPRTFDVGSQGRMKTILKMINSKAEDHCISV